MNPFRLLLALLVLWSCFSDWGLITSPSEVNLHAAPAMSHRPPLDPRYLRPNEVEELLGDPDLAASFHRL